MPQRIVVSFRGVLAAERAASADYLSRALATKKRAEVHGGTLCAWSAQTFSFDFAPDELEEAIGLAAIALADAAQVEGTAPKPSYFMVGVSQGELSHVGEGGSFAALSWGPPLVTAVALAREAAAGEVLLDPELLLARSTEIAELGWFIEPDLRRGAHRLRAATSGLYEPVRIPPAATTDPPMSDAAALDAVPPPSRRARIPQPLSAARAPLPTVPEDAFSEMAKRAIVQGDVAALERLIAQLRESGQSADAVERLSGLLALRRGATSEALRKLRAAADAEQLPAQRARARLAYAVALASAGRAEAALLEALAALARAREAGDENGEVACARLLARISAGAGQLTAAQAWARVAARNTTPGG